MAMQRVKDETAIPTTAFIVEVARAEAIPILPEKGRSTIGEDMPEDKTDEWGMWTEWLCACTVRSCGEEMKEGCPSTQVQDTMEDRRMAAYRERGPVAFGERQAGKRK